MGGYEPKRCVDVTGQSRMGKLVPGDRKETVTQITTGYYQVMQTSISEQQKMTLVPLLSANNRKVRLWRTREDGKNGAWSDESR